MSTQRDLPLPLPPASNAVTINARCSLRIEADQRAIVVAGLPVHRYCADDAVAEAYAMVLGGTGLRPNGCRTRAMAAAVLGSQGEPGKASPIRGPKPCARSWTGR